MLVDDARNLEDYLARFDVTLSVMQTADALERIAYELAIDAARDGVRYIEVRYAPVLNVRGGLTLDEAVEAPLRGLERAERDGGAMGRVIVCGLRNLAPDVSLRARRARRGVTSIAASSRSTSPAASWAIRRRRTRRRSRTRASTTWPCTCHAGEGAGASSVREAVHVCGAHRIGHATRLIEDESLTQYVNDRRIALEICLTSNVQTHAVESYEQHPLREYFDRGMNVVLNTDNRLMSGTTLTDEYVHAAKALGFSFDELCDDRAQRIRERVSAVGGARAADRSRAADIADARRRARRDDAVRRARRRARPRSAIRARLARRDPDVGDRARLGTRRPRRRDRHRSATIPFRDIPGFPTATVAGHAGALIVGRSRASSVVALAGRFHMYEGHDVRLAAFPGARGSRARRADADRVERGGRRESPAGSRAI